MTKKEWMILFGNKVKEIMNQKGLTQKELAEQIGVPQGTLSNYILGKQVPSVKAVINLSYATGIAIQELCFYGERVKNK